MESMVGSHGPTSMKRTIRNCALRSNLTQCMLYMDTVHKMLREAVLDAAETCLSGLLLHWPSAVQEDCKFWVVLATSASTT